MLVCLFLGWVSKGRVQWACSGFTPHFIFDVGATIPTYVTSSRSGGFSAQDRASFPAPPAPPPFDSPRVASCLLFTEFAAEGETVFPSILEKVCSVGKTREAKVVGEEAAPSDGSRFAA